jgi:ribosomal protein S18 acetylase RimI-like enzyme
VTIRTATPADAAALHSVAAATFPLACPPDAKPEAIQHFIDEHLAVLNFERYLADPVRQLLIAEVDGVGLGYTMLVFAEPTDPDVVAAITKRPTVELSKCYILADSHGSGLATELMTATLAAASDRGAAGVWLGVNQQNERANRFYAKHGFERVGTKKFLVGERWEDDYVLERVLERML